MARRACDRRTDLSQIAEQLEGLTTKSRRSVPDRGDPRLTQRISVTS